MICISGLNSLSYRTGLAGKIQWKNPMRKKNMINCGFYYPELYPMEYPTGKNYKNTMNTVKYTYIISCAKRYFCLD